MKIPKSVTWVYVTIVLLVITFIFSWWFSRYTLPKGTQSSVALAVNKKPLYWVAPMNPNYRRDKPGKSPMGMDLVPIYKEPSEAGVVKISPTIEHNLGVRTAEVTSRIFYHVIKTVGYVQPDEGTLKTISIYTKGWVRDLQVQSPGDLVEKNNLLFKLYSPTLISAQEEYLLAIKHHNQLLIRPGRQKLITLGVSENTIKELMTSKKVRQNVPVYAPQSGYITELNVKEGSHVMPATSLMSIANLSTVWIIAEVYEKKAALLKIGQPVTVQFTGLPGEKITGKINYIYPALNAKNRTVRVRIVISNKKDQLKPDMYAHITIDGGKATAMLAIPKEALIPLGKNTRVVLALGNGRFKPVEVDVGHYNQGWASITHGLSKGQQVVTSAQFLLDSESNLKAGLERLTHKGEQNNEVNRQHGQHMKQENTKATQPLDHNAMPDTHNHHHMGH